MLKIFSIFIVIIGLSSSPKLYSQSFGFGCLGLVGGYGGYNYQVYKPSGLNTFIQFHNQIRGDSLSSPMSEFGKAAGFRVGLNLYRANLEGLILTAKGFYQMLLEKQGSLVISSLGTTSDDIEVRMKSWGIGFDLGTSITGAFSWKVIDAALLFNTTSLSQTQNYPGAVTIVNNYSSDANVGYSVGTGFILAIIDSYISLEGLVAYTALKVTSVSMDDGTPLYINENSMIPLTNFIEAGGFNAVIQLNIGFPL